MEQLKPDITLYKSSDFQGNAYARRLMPDMWSKTGVIETTTRQLKGEPRTPDVVQTRLIKYDQAYVVESILNLVEGLEMDAPTYKKVLNLCFKKLKYGRDWNG